MIDKTIKKPDFIRFSNIKEIISLSNKFNPETLWFWGFIFASIFIWYKFFKTPYDYKNHRVFCVSRIK